MSIRTSQSGARSRADELEAALTRAGLVCRVEGRDSLAVLTAEADVAQRMGNPETRRQALALAREHGFTHLALELA